MSFIKNSIFGINRDPCHEIYVPVHVGEDWNDAAKGVEVLD